MRTLIVIAAALAAGCSSLPGKIATVSPGDTPQAVLSKVGPPDDRQFEGAQEAWQYCATGAGFGYHDHRIVWFRDGRVTGLTSFKSTTPGVSCTRNIQPINWSHAPRVDRELQLPK